MHLVTRMRRLQLLNASSTAHYRVPGIGKELQTRETIEADHTLEHGGKGMKAGHCHVQKNGRGGGRDHVPIIQRIFTHTKSKSITDHDHIQLIQGIFTETKSITDREHHHVQKPEAVTVTCTPDFIHQILCRQNITQDHYPDHQYVHGKTVTNFQTLPHKNHVRLHNLDCHPVHNGEKLANL